MQLRSSMAGVTPRFRTFTGPATACALVLVLVVAEAPGLVSGQDDGRIAIGGGGAGGAGGAGAVAGSEYAALLQQQQQLQPMAVDDQLLYDVLVKRPSGPHRYGFGLGKRSPEPMPAQPFVDEAMYPGFKRRQYNFGLGKRPWPMTDYEEYRKRKYNFGLGKRSD